MAELCAKISSTAKTARAIRIGVSHQRLLLQKKENSCPAVLKRLLVVLKIPISLSPKSKRPSQTKGSEAVRKTVPDFTLLCSGFSKPERKASVRMLQLWDTPNCNLPPTLANCPIMKCSSLRSHRVSKGY